MPVRICPYSKQYTSSGPDSVWNVASNSMFPVLRNGDLVAVDKTVAFEDVQMGDIIVFREPVPTEEKSSAIISRVNDTSILS